MTIVDLGEEQRDLSFLGCLHTVRDWITIRDSLHLESTAGMKNLKSAEALVVYYNRDLRMISGLEQIEDLNYLTVFGNPSIEEIRLDALRTVRDTLSIGLCEGVGEKTHHPALASLSGFSSLTKVGVLQIDGNGALTSAGLFDALAANGDPEPLRGADVRHNLKLSEAEVHAKLDALGVAQEYRTVCGNEGSVTECMYCAVGD